MANNKIITKKYETFIVTIMLFIFFMGFFMGWNYADNSMSKTEINLEKARLDLNSFSQSLSFVETLNNSICNKNQIQFLNKQLSSIAKELEEYENNGNENNEYYQLLKEKHNINQVQFYTFYNHYSTQCQNSSTMILFFFDSKNPKKSQQQGTELDKLVENYDIIVLPMDYGYSKNLEYFYNYYKSTQLPTLVINYKKVFNNFTQYKTLEQYINQTQKTK